MLRTPPRRPPAPRHGDRRRRRHVRPARVPDPAATTCSSRSSRRGARTCSTRSPTATPLLWFSTPFCLASLLDVARRDRRLPDRARRAVPRTAAVPSSQRRGRRRRWCWAKHITRRDRPRAGPDMADDPAARALHRAHGSGRRRHRQDVRLHVSVRGPAPALAARRRRPQGGRPGDGGEGRLLPAGAGHPRATRGGPTTTSRSGSTPASATTRCTTISIRTRWPTRSPRC